MDIFFFRDSIDNKSDTTKNNSCSARFLCFLLLLKTKKYSRINSIKNDRRKEWIKRDLSTKVAMGFWLSGYISGQSVIKISSESTEESESTRSIRRDNSCTQDKGPIDESTNRHLINSLQFKWAKPFWNQFSFHFVYFSFAPTRNSYGIPMQDKVGQYCAHFSFSRLVVLDECIHLIGWLETSRRKPRQINEFRNK